MASKEALKQMFSDGMKPTGDDFSQLIDGVEGPQGPQGPQGPKGEDGVDGQQGTQGNPGADGKDGFGTEAQYNDIIARLEALEGAE